MASIEPNTLVVPAPAVAAVPAPAKSTETTKTTETAEQPAKTTETADPAAPAEAPTSDSATAPLLDTPRTPAASPPPTAGRTSKRQSHVVSFDKTLENILKLDKYDLEIQDTELVITDKENRKKNRRRCVPSSFRQKIPLYNVLWADVSADGNSLTIDYAAVASKTRLQAAKQSYALDQGPDRPTPAEATTWAELLRARAYDKVPQRRRAYVLVNPHAGPGGALKKWELDAKPLLEAARMQLTVETTTHSGQAVDLCAAMDIDAFDMVIPCSGDGLPHECFNGLGKRPDARRALARIAVAHLPCGSGNAMACNLYGSHRVSVAALAIVKGVVAPLDLASITYGNERILSFLSQAVGIVAEVDLGTEHLRWMGGARFTWGFFERLLARKVYPCELSVKVEIDHKDAVKRHYSHQRAAGSGSGSGSGSGKTGAPATRSRQQRERERAKLGSSSASVSVAADSIAEEAEAEAGADTEGEASSSGQTEAEAESGGLPPLQYGTVQDPLPGDWETIPGDKMGNFYCGNMAYMAPDANFFSAALMNDGLMDLVTVDGDISPAKSLAMLLSVEDNRFFDNPLVHYRKISAFRLAPKAQKDGYISIDGERIPFVPFQAEMHRGLGRVIAQRTGNYAAPGPSNWDRVTAVDRFMA